MAKTLAKNSLYTLIANVALAASNWLVLVLLAKSFATNQLGVFVLTLSLFSPAFLLASFKIRTLLIVDHDWTFKPEEYACARILANIVAIFSVIVLAALFYQTLPLTLLVMVAVYKFADACSEYCQSYLRRHQHFEIISYSTLIRAVFTVSSLIVGISMDASFNQIIMIWMISAVVFSVVDSVLFLSRWDEPQLDRFAVSRIININTFHNASKIYTKHFTIAVALLVGALFVHAPNYALAYYFTPSEAGIFATISYFLIAGGILINSLSQAATPQLAQSYQAGNQSVFNTIVVKLCSVGVLLGCLGVVIALILGEWILLLFYNAQIAAHADVLAWVMVAAGIRYLYIFLGTALGAVQQFKVQTSIAGLGFLVLIVGLWFLVPQYAMIGAAQAMVLATVAECFAYVVIFRHYVMKAFSQSTAMQVK